MAAGGEVVWLVGRIEELGLLQEAIEPVDATIQETWPGDANAGVVALVRAAPAGAAAVADALGSKARSFGDERAAREAATDLALSS